MVLVSQFWATLYRKIKYREIITQKKNRYLNKHNKKEVS